MSVFEDFGKQQTGLSITETPAGEFGAPFWGDYPGLWDQVQLAGIILPGLARLSGDLEHRVDRRRIPGQDGERITHLGCKPAEIEITLRMWTEEHLNAFSSLAPVLRPQPKAAAPDPVDIVHPATHLYGIKAIQVLRISLPVPVGDGDVYEVKIRGVEFVPLRKGAKSKVKTPTSSTDIATIPNEAARTARESQAKPSQTSSGPGTPESSVTPTGFAAYLKGGGR